MAVPSKQGSITLFSRATVDPNNDNWTEHYLLGDNTANLGHGEHDVCICQFTPCGGYLLSADVAGQIVIWKLDSIMNKYVPVKKLNMSEKSKITSVCVGENDKNKHTIQIFVTTLTDYTTFNLDTTLLTVTEQEAITALAEAEAETAVEAQVQAQADDMIISTTATTTAVNNTNKKRLKTNKHEDEDDDDIFNDEIIPKNTTNMTSPTRNTTAGTANGTASRLTSPQTGTAVKIISPKVTNTATAATTTSTSSTSAITTSKQDVYDINANDDDEDDDSMIDQDMPSSSLNPFSTSASAVTAAVIPWRYHEPLAVSRTSLDEKQRRYLCWNYIGK